MSRSTAVAVAPGKAPRPPRRRLPIAAVVAVIVLAAGVSVALVVTPSGGGTWLEVVDQRTGQVLHDHPIGLGERFTLEHTHSVTKRLVSETFSVQAGPIVAIEELWFDEPGPNLPAGAEPLGEGMTTFLHEDGAFRVLHHGYPIGEVPLLVGSADVDHVLNLPDGERVRLLDVASPATPVALRAR